ncbi:hypothetical protein GSY74_07495 [Sulfurovum sp. bin170]|uniref:hypothetical protein n=1 Tax=Sulfurovum sp. bin170 TaxID=2695268 RepID=UPI0013DFE902|nr:hypothetical protein [Sulfurovum sp. bin170]NEW61122.1 hypothetical protein [Sulfurovum sp. bin170]
MSVIIQSTIKTNPLGRWYIELRDTTEEESMEICLDIEEYAKKIEIMGLEYGGDIEVAWQSDDDVSQMQIHEVRMQMNEYQTKKETEGEMRKTHQPDGTPNFQG